MENVYYSPDKFGLETVAAHDFSDGCYQFDLRVIWKHKLSGRFYTDRDSGCSCPSPFEGVREISDLEICNFVELIEEAREAQRDGYSGESITHWVEELRDLMRDNK